MEVSRRDFIKGSSALLTALGAPSVLMQRAAGLETADGGVPVIWIQGQSCSGCSVSLLNSIYYMTIDQLLLGTLDVDFHPTLSAAAGNLAVSTAERAYRHGGYVLVVEGAIPTGAGGKYCQLWPGLTFQKAVERYAERAAFVLGVGTCACFGGMAAGAPNPTGAQGLASYYGTNRTIKIPGCPTHPDWVVGTVASILANGTIPALDSQGRPTAFFAPTVHAQCPNLADYNSKYAREVGHAGTQACLACHSATDGDVPQARVLGRAGCLYALGCKGRTARADCSTRRWNSPATNQIGINFCIGAGAPCYGCTDSNFPDGMSPFYSLNGPGADD